MCAALRNRVALVTGATRRVGIGAAIARELAAAGADVLISFYRAYDATMPWGVARDEPEALIEELRQSGVRAEGCEIDLSQPDAPRALVERAYAVFGRLDILVNNAAHSETTTIDRLDAVALDRHYAVNLRATALLCAEFVRRISSDEGGRIINLTSGQGQHAMPDELAYAATKGAVDALTLSLSAALAPRRITVNAVDPGPTDTGWMPPPLKAALESRAPMGRVGLPRDAARLVCFLASTEAVWITRQIIRSRGGE
jgi:3-oxoacyl-[acyl-carrier protein] reductase